MREFKDSCNITNYIYSKEELEVFSTERLVMFMHHHQKYRHDSYGQAPIFVEQWGEGKYIEVEADWSEDNNLRAYYWANEEELREILKTRPNIPNKAQRRQIRKDIIAKNRKKTKRKWLR